MYGLVALPSKSIQEYAGIVGKAAVEELQELARPLRGLRVLHLSVTAFGTRMADLLSSTVPLLTDLGLDCSWQVIRPTEEFSHVTHAMYSALARGIGTWDSSLNETWERYAAMNAELLTEPFDVVVVHDPQPAAIRSFVEASGHQQAKWVLHCHLDLTQANEAVWMLLRTHIDRYDRVIFESSAMARADLRAPVQIITPAIDPLAPRNMELSEETVRTVCGRYGIDCARPLIAQISPFDEAHDPLRAVTVFELAAQQIPGLQLLLIATVVPQEAVARAYFDRVATQAAAHTNVYVLSELSYVGNIEINVCQRAACVVFQAALHKGYGLHIAEALWKARPAVGPPSGGIPEQIIDGQTGFLATTVEDTADRIVTLLRDPELARRLGEAGRERVRNSFLITRYLRDYLHLFHNITHAQ